jgi:hypothetical protein
MKQRITLEQLGELSPYEYYRYGQMIGRKSLYALEENDGGYALPLLTIGQMIEFLVMHDVGFGWWSMKYDDRRWYIKQQYERCDLFIDDDEELCDVLWARIKQLLAQE